MDARWGAALLQLAEPLLMAEPSGADRRSAIPKPRWTRNNVVTLTQQRVSCGNCMLGSRLKRRYGRYQRQRGGETAPHDLTSFTQHSQLRTSGSRCRFACPSAQAMAPGGKIDTAGPPDRPVTV